MVYSRWRSERCGRLCGGSAGLSRGMCGLVSAGSRRRDANLGRLYSHANFVVNLDTDALCYLKCCDECVGNCLIKYAGVRTAAHLDLQVSSVREDGGLFAIQNLVL